MLTTREHELELPDGRNLHYYDTQAENGSEPGLAVFWLHGSPSFGEPPVPLFEAAATRGLRWVSYDRPSYGGSTSQPGRDVAAAAADVAAVAEALGLGQFAVVGYSGGGPHALACAALLAERVLATVTVACVGPYGVEGLNYFDGMGVEAELRAAVRGRAELEHELTTVPFDPSVFTQLDYAALSAEWNWLNVTSGKAFEQGLDGLIDDDLATVQPWGFDVTAIDGPVLMVHGDDDRMVPASHTRWLADHVPGAELRLSPGVGHVSVLQAEAEAALEWIRTRAV